MNSKHKLPIKYKKPIRISTWIINIFSIVVAFFSLPPALSVIIAVCLTTILYVVEKIIFVQKILWVYSFEESLHHRLGVAWSKDIDDGKVLAGLNSIAESKSDAKKMYQLFKAWCYGKYSGNDDNIKITFVMEGESRYSVFIYPGRRKSKQSELERQIESGQNEKNVENVFSKSLFQYIYNCNEFGTRPEIKELFDIIRINNQVLINTCYIKDNKLVSYAKKGISIRNIEFIERANITSGRLEYECEWLDPNKKARKKSEKLSKVEI